MKGVVAHLNAKRRARLRKVVHKLVALLNPLTPTSIFEATNLLEDTLDREIRRRASRGPRRGQRR